VSAVQRRWAIALAVSLSLGCAVLAHYAIVEAHSPTLGALLSLLPLVCIVLAVLRRSRHRALGLTGVALGGVALWLGWGFLERHFTNLFFIEHAGMNLLLGVTFGRTLLGAREPLCTRFARIIHGTLEPDVVRYTGRVTAAWTIFFFTLFTLSCVLYFGKFLAAWSFLANIASPILIGTMFVVEYAIRIRALPGHKRIGILGSFRAFSRHFAQAPAGSPR
jgi:uncharacterized membrane protein